MDQTREIDACSGGHHRLRGRLFDYMEHTDEGVESIHVASSRRQLFAKTHSHKSPQPGNMVPSARSNLTEEYP